MRTLFQLGVAVLLLAGLTEGWAQAPKIAVVDMAKLVRSHPDTKSAESLLEKQMDEFEAEQKDAEDKFQKLKKEYEEARALAENKALTDAAREEKRATAEEKREAVRSYEAKASEALAVRRREIADQRVRIQKRIVGKVLAVVREYAAKNGYTLVLDSAGLSISGVEMILYSADQVDITEELLKIVSSLPSSAYERKKDGVASSATNAAKTRDQQSGE